MIPQEKLNQQNSQAILEKWFDDFDFDHVTLTLKPTLKPAFYSYFYNKRC